MHGKTIVAAMLTFLIIATFVLAFHPRPLEASGSVHMEADGGTLSRPPETEWNKTYGGTSDDRVPSVIQTSDKGYALAGRTKSYGAGDDDFWLVKTDVSGNVQWNKTYGKTSSDVAWSVVQTTDGGYAIAGWIETLGINGMDAWLVKTDSSGNMQWNKTYGGTSQDYASSLIKTNDGGYALAGYTNSYGAGNVDYWLVKTDSSGNMQWNKAYGGTGNDVAQSVVQTSDGGYAITGMTTSYGAGSEDFWLVKTDSSGNVQWNQTYGGASTDWAESAIQTSDGGYALTGYTSSYGAGSSDFWLVKTDSSGNMLWNVTYGGWTVDAAYSMVKTSDGGYALAGETMSYGAGSDDFWLIKLSSEFPPSTRYPWPMFHNTPAHTGYTESPAPATNQTLWKYNVTTPIFSSSTAVADGKVYVASYYRVYCLDASTGAHVWNYTTGYGVDSSPAVADGKVYVGSDDRNVYCLNAATGERIWNYTTGDWVQSSPAVADGKVYVGSDDGKVYCLDALTGAEIWSYTTGDFVWSSPAVADGVVYVGSSDNFLYAFGNVTRVPEDYPTIQAAVNVAAPGATIWIAPGVYNESITINKTLTILGKKGSNPIFDGGGSGIAITLLSGASGSTVVGIVITHWSQGILMVDSGNCKIYDNIMSLITFNGITLQGSSATNNLIYNNVFQNNAIAINVTASSTSNTIYNNVITLNNIGLNLESSGNLIYHNNFVANSIHISITASIGNTLDDGYPSGGNYWSGHTLVDLCCGPSQIELGSDGINDTSYAVAGGNIDWYPLAKPYSGPRDIGIASLIKSKTVVGQGFTFSIDLKIQNYGVFNEIFILTLYCNDLPIHVQVIGLTTRNSTTITIQVNTATYAKGNYVIKAAVSIVEDESDTSDNNVTGGIVYVGIPGDVNGDNVVDSTDLGILGGAWGSFLGDSNYNPNADIDGSEVIDSTDLGIMGGHWGEME